MSWADDEGISGYDIEGELDAAERRRPRTRHTITPQQELKWRTKEGVYYYPWEMTDSHLENCLLHIEGIYGGQAPKTMWHQVFRCELKRREVQNAHQPPHEQKINFLLSPFCTPGTIAGVAKVKVGRPILSKRPIRVKKSKRVAAKRPPQKGRKTK